MRSSDPVFNVSFVGIIERHPCLYAFNTADYNNRAVQEKTWEAVAKEVNESVSDCKERWKNIRGCFTRYLKSLNMPGSGGKKQPYYLAEPLSFLLQYTKSRQSLEYFNSHEPSISSLEPSVTLKEDVDHRDDDGSASLSQDWFSYDHESSSDVKIDHEFASPNPSHKRLKLSKDSFAGASIDDTKNENVDYLQYNKELRDEKKTEDSDLAFLTSLITDMKEMNQNQKRRFKIGILSLAGQILNEPSSSYHASGSCQQEDLAMTPASSCSSSPASTTLHR